MCYTFVIMFFNALTVPVAEIVLLKPFNLKDHSVKLPTQKHFIFLLSFFNFKNLTAFELVNINASYLSVSTGPVFAEVMLKVGK